MKNDKEKLNFRLETKLFLVVNVILFLIYWFFGDQASTAAYIFTVPAVLTIFVLTLFWIRFLIHAENYDTSAKIFGFLLAVITFTNATILLYAELYLSFGLVQGGEQLAPSRVDALYFSVVTFTTLGYGDFTPTHSLKLVAASRALLGYFIFAVLSGTFVGMLLQKPIPELESTHDDEGL